MIEDKLKYLEKYTSGNNKGNFTSNILKRKLQSKNKSTKIKIIDEADDINTDINNNNNLILDQESENISSSNNKKNEQTLWLEMNEEDNEDEINAIRTAQVDSKINDDKVIGNKRQRHDSDSEGEEENDKQIIINEHDEVNEESETEKELNELIKDEDGDIILNEKKTGLILEFKSNKEIRTKKDEKALQKEKEKMKKETIYRDEQGRQIEKSQTKEYKKKGLEKLNYDNLQKWGKGIIQKEEAIKNKKEIQLAKNEPFARHDIDTRTEDEYRKKNRFGDPMKGLLSIHKYEGGVLSNVSDPHVSRGFYLPSCKFKGTINRFGIEPGFRWDGVDRGTKFEIKYLESINVRKARDEEYHKLRTEEM